MPWYHGPTVLEALTSWRPRTGPRTTPASPFRMPVQYVVRADDFRGYAGTVVAGVGAPGRQGRGQRQGLDDHGRARPRRRQGRRGGHGPARPSTLTLETETDVTRGDLLVAPAEGAAAETVPAPRNGVRRRPGVDRRGGAAARPLLPAARRVARRPGRRHGDPRPARRRLRRRDGRPHAEDERHRPRRDLHRHPGAARPLRALPRHRRLPARRAGQPRHRRGRAGAPRTAPRAQRRAARLHRRPGGPRRC